MLDIYHDLYIKTYGEDELDDNYVDDQIIGDDYQKKIESSNNT